MMLLLETVNVELSEELQRRLLESLDKTSLWLEQAEGLAREQTPLIIDELLRWGFLSGVGNILMGLGFCVASFFLLGRCKKSYEEYKLSNRYDADPPFAAAFWGTAVVLSGFAGGFSFSAGVYALARVLATPRLYIIDQLASLL